MYAQTANVHRDMLTSRFPTCEECRPIFLWATRSCRRRGALIGVQPLGPHQHATGESLATCHAPRRNAGARVDKLASSPPRSRRPTEVVRSERRAAVRWTQRESYGCRRGGSRGFARRAHHTVVTRESFGFRHLALSRSGQPLDQRSGPACRGYI